MSEPNPAAEAPAAEAPAGPAWPELPSVSGPGSSAKRSASGTDPAVSVILTRLRVLPEMAVSDHHVLYTQLHDGLHDALNEDVVGDATEGKDAS